jgi:hypothetical protein
VESHWSSKRRASRARRTGAKTGAILGKRKPSGRLCAWPAPFNVRIRTRGRVHRTAGPSMRVRSWRRVRSIAT